MIIILQLWNNTLKILFVMRYFNEPKTTRRHDTGDTFHFGGFIVLIITLQIRFFVCYTDNIIFPAESNAGKSEH